MPPSRKLGNNSMENFQPLIKQIEKVTGIAFHPADEEELLTLQEIGFPEIILDFYAKYAPDDYTEGKIRLWTIDDIFAENTELLPGCYISPHGYFVFASTEHGDSYCFDMNNLNEQGYPRIVLLSHEIVDENITADEIHQIAKPVAQNLLVFLEKFLNNKL